MNQPDLNNIIKTQLESQQDFAISNIATSCDNLVVEVESGAILTALDFCKNNPNLRYRTLVDLFVIDGLSLDYPKRFAVVYNLLSYKLNHRLTIKTYLAENETIASATSAFLNANWYEREAFDMYGISFNNHPDLRRILTDYGFEGYPLRKDFPLTGNYQLRYDPTIKEIVKEPVFLSQEFRKFDFSSPWFGPNYNNKTN